MNSAAVSASRYVSRASGTSSGSSRRAAASSSGGASLPRLVANAIRARRTSAWARWNVIERADLGSLDQRDGVVDRTRLVLRSCGCQRPAGASRGLDRQRGRTFEECGGRGEPAACLGTRRRTFQVRGDVFVRHDRCLGSVPGAAIRVGIRIRRFRESLMDLGPLDGAGGPIHRGANERMPEGNAWPECDQTARLRREGR